MQELRQSTEMKVRVGSAVDATDGVSPETGLTLGAADQAELLKHNGAATVDISGATFAAVTAVDGWYDLTLTASHTDTLGQLTVVIQDSSLMAPIFRDFMVVTANYWDSKYSTDVLQVDVTQWLGTAAATPTVAGVPEVDVTHWLGTAVTANIAGQPTVDITRIGASTQSLIDLKDFVDSGYDPVTNKVQGVVLVDTTTTNTDMAGTDNAALASVCTETRLAELDAANLPTDIADIPTVAEFEARTIVSPDYPTETEMTAAFTEIKGATWAAGTDTLEHIRNKQTDIETDTAEIGTAGAGLTDLGGMSTGMKAEVNTEADTALTDYDPPTDTEMIARTLPAADYVVTSDTIAGVTTATNLTNAPTSGDLTATMKTSVNTEVSDVLKTDTISEMAQGIPSATPTFEAALMYQYMAWRNEVTQTSSTLSLKDDGGTVITKATVSDDATTFTKGEMVSGP